MAAPPMTGTLPTTAAVAGVVTSITRRPLDGLSSATTSVVPSTSTPRAVPGVSTVRTSRGAAGLEMSMMCTPLDAVRHVGEVARHDDVVRLARRVERAEQPGRRRIRDVDDAQASGAVGDVDPVAEHAHVVGVAGRVERGHDHRRRRIGHVDDTGGLSRRPRHRRTPPLASTLLAYPGIATEPRAVGVKFVTVPVADGREAAVGDRDRARAVRRTKHPPVRRAEVADVQIARRVVRPALRRRQVDRRAVLQLPGDRQLQRADADHAVDRDREGRGRHGQRLQRLRQVEARRRSSGCCPTRSRARRARRRHRVSADSGLVTNPSAPGVQLLAVQNAVVVAVRVAQIGPRERPRRGSTRRPCRCPRRHRPGCSGSDRARARDRRAAHRRRCRPTARRAPT